MICLAVRRITNLENKKVVLNLPNKLTLSRIIMIPVFVVFFYVQFTGHYFVALAVFLIACLTDLLDGMIARKYNLVTNLGKFLDPIADKVLVLTALVIFLTIPDVVIMNIGSIGLILIGCGVALIIAREIIVSGFRMIAASTGTVIAADVFGKYKTVFQDVAIVILLVGFGINELTDNHVGMIVTIMGYFCLAMAVLLTLISGINYIVKNINVLKDDSK